MNEDASDIMANGKNGGQLFSVLIEILIFVFTDRISLVSDTISLTFWQKNANALELFVNLENQILLFFTIKDTVHAIINGVSIFVFLPRHKVDVANSYKYLRLYTHTRLFFKELLKRLKRKPMEELSTYIK